MITEINSWQKSWYQYNGDFKEQAAFAGTISIFNAFIYIYSVMSPLSVRASFRNELMSENAPRISPKLGMNLEDNKGKKIAEPLFLKKNFFCSNLAKRAEN